MPEPLRPEHGGDLTEASRRYGAPEGGWVDLSTGINPWGYPVPEVPASAWQSLPTDDGLVEAAGAYYGTDQLLPVPGSQAAIQALSRLRRRCRVAVLWPTYAEHAFRWHRAGHDVVRVAAQDLEIASGEVDVLVVTNPNNPDGTRFAPEHLRHWRRRLARRDGWLVVDEAFADVAPGLSLAAEAGEAGLVVLRSPGKFFGLAGARVGFAVAERAVREGLSQELGPWPVAGPARVAAEAALADKGWQHRTRAALAEAGDRLERLLEEAGLVPGGATPLFQWVPLRQAEPVHRTLAQQGIWTRYFSEPSGVRLGVPAREEAWGRLRRALAGLPPGTVPRGA